MATGPPGSRALPWEPDSGDVGHPSAAGGGAWGRCRSVRDIGDVDERLALGRCVRLVGCGQHSSPGGQQGLQSLPSGRSLSSRTEEKCAGRHIDCDHSVVEHATATFYCDESGNTGTHWADPDQPVFAYAGWLVPSDAQDAVLGSLDEIRSRYRIQGDELKWSSIGRRANGAAVFRELFQLLLNGPAMPFFIIADKDYHLAAKVIETYFDPEYNPNLAPGFTGAMTVKKELAEVVLGAPAILSEFAGWIRAGSEPAADDVFRMAGQLRKHFAAVGQADAASALSGFTAEGVSGIQSEFAADAWARTTTGHTLFGLLQRLEAFLRAHDLEVEIVHDQLVRFDPLLDMMRGLFREADGPDAYQVEESVIYLRMPTVTGLRLADSKAEPLVQAADLLAGFLRTVFTKLRRSEALDAEEHAVVHDLFMIHHRWSTWDANMPEAMWSAFSEAAFPSGAPPSP